MTQFMALLRATQIAGHTAKMEDRRRLGDTLGFANVETLIIRKYP